MIAEARTKGIKVHFASLMDLCHLENSELEICFQKYKRPSFRGDPEKHDSGSYAVFTEQGSAPQMTAAKVMDIMSRLGCAGQAADAESAKTQVKMEDAPKLLKIPKSECPDIWIRLPRHKWPKSRSSMEDPVVPLERNQYGHPLAGPRMKGHLTEKHGPGETTRRQTTSRPGSVWPYIYGKICRKRRSAKQSKSGLSRNQSSITPENYVVSSSLNLRMRNSETSWKNARRKLEIPMPAAMPCKTPMNSGGETYFGIGKTKTKHACFVEADESTRIRL